MSRIENPQSPSVITSPSAEDFHAERAQVSQQAAPARVTPVPQQGVVDQITQTMNRMHRLADSEIKYSNKSLDTKVFEKNFSTNVHKSQHVQDLENLIKVKVFAVNETMAALDAKNIMELANATKDNAVYALIDNAISEQHKLKEALILYSKETGINVQEHIERCVSREAEILNFVGTIVQGGLSEKMQKQSASENINTVALEMHGVGNLVQEMSAELKTIYENIDSLEGQRERMSDKDFAKTIRTVRSALTTMLDKVASEKKTSSLHYDAKAFQAITLSASAAEKRLVYLENLTTMQAVQNMYADFKASYGPPTQEDFRFLTTLPLNETLRNALAQNYRNMNDFFEVLDKSTKPTDRLDAIIQKSTKFYSRNFTKLRFFSDCAALAKINNEEKYNAVLQAFYANYPDVSKDIEKRLILPLRQREMENPGSLSRLTRPFERILSFEYVKMQNFARNAPKNTHKTGDFIHMAFDGSVNINTLIESNIRGLAATKLALDAVDANLLSEKSIGSGAANQVFLCKYRSDTGNDVSYVFKGEHDAKRGLSHLAVQRLGHNADIYINNLNLASTEVAELIGCESAIAKSSIGLHKGQFGLFMEHAPGATARDISFGTTPPSVYSKVDGTACSLAQLQHALSIDEQKIFMSSLVKELTKLEWADALSGQVDRHADNYLFSLNPQNFQVKITGIDNDASFTQGVVGLAKVRMDNGTGMFENFDISGKLPDKVFEVAKGYGINQMFKPLFITEDTYNKLQQINENDYKNLLKNRMGRGEIASAIARLKDAKAHAEQLKKNNLCFSDEQWLSMDFLEALSQAKDTQQDLQQRQRNFFVRDFGSLFAMVETLKGKAS